MGVVSPVKNRRFSCSVDADARKFVNDFGVSPRRGSWMKIHDIPPGEVEVDKDWERLQKLSAWFKSQREARRN